MMPDQTREESDLKLTLLYQDEWLVAVNKPSGLLVHRSWLDKGETRFAMQMTRDLIGGRHVYPVHRLDRPTSGVLLFALSPKHSPNVRCTRSIWHWCAVGRPSWG